MKSPELDPRRFQQLLEQAVAQVKRSCPEWTDFTPGDPGVTLLEAYAFLTEKLISHLNQLPELAYVEFLRLLGLQLRPSAAAEVQLRFSVPRAASQAVSIPEGTRVSATRDAAGEAPVFYTTEVCTIEEGETEVFVRALNCEWISGELLGTSNGQAGQSFRIKAPPVIAPTGDRDDLLVGVEVESQQVGDRVHAITLHKKVYQIWGEIENFANTDSDARVYLSDRYLGRITFAPAIVNEERTVSRGAIEALAGIPPLGAEVRVWYRRGGGAEGNVAANTITTMKDVIAGVAVNNPRSAGGGRDAETLSHALVRGPQELHSLERAVTASDFELLSMRAGGISRAKAATQSDLWRHATPGTVEVLLVPRLEDNASDASRETLDEAARDTDRRRIELMLADRKPLGTACIVRWVRYKTVAVKARVSVYPGVDKALVKQRALERLGGLINPIPNKYSESGWEFGMPLRASAIYDVLLGDAGVRFVDNPVLSIEDVPDCNVAACIVDCHQPHTWYASSGCRLFRSINDGAGWEFAQAFELPVVRLKSHPSLPGMVAALVGEEGKGSSIYLSRDCGDRWERVANTSFQIFDLDWAARTSPPQLLLAAANGLYKLSISANSSPVQIVVDEDNHNIGVRALATRESLSGSTCVAIALSNRKGVFLSHDFGRTGSFKKIGLENDDVRTLKIQREGVRDFLWAGVTVAGNEDGKGCIRWEMTGDGDPSSSRQDFYLGWRGGSCRALAFFGSQVFAGTHDSGVLRLDASRSEAKWEGVKLQCGLTPREEKRLFAPVRCLAASGSGDAMILLTGMDSGLFHSEDGENFSSASEGERTDVVTVPPTWLFCSGNHELEVVTDDDD